jgi:iron complex outermembrane receptor protein
MLSVVGASLLSAQVPDQEALAAELRGLINAPNEGASRRIQRAIDSPQAVEVITAEQIRAIGAFRLADVLKMATSVQVWDLDGDRASVTLRGVAPSGLGVTVQILLDGIPLYNAVGEPVNLNALPVPIDAIEKIEIVRGPSSSLYGANAQMGVIAISTRRAGYGESGSLRAGLTSNGMHRQEGFFSIKEGPWSLVASGAGESNKDLGRPRAAMSANGTPLSSPDATHGARVFLRPEYQLGGGGRLWAAYGYGEVGHGNDGIFDLVQSDRLGTMVNRATISEVGQVGWKQAWAPTFSTDFRLDQKSYRQRMSPVATMPGNPDSPAAIQALEAADPALATRHDFLRDRIQRGSMQANWDPSDKLHLVGGFDASKIEVGANKLFGFDQDATYTAAGAYLSIDWTLGSLALSGGARAANESLGGSSVSPRLSAVWTLDDSSVIRAGFFTSTRSPMALEKEGSLSPSPIEPFVLRRNQDLQSEKTTDYELGYRKTWSRVSLDITAFHTVIRRLILLGPIGTGTTEVGFQNRPGTFNDNGVEVSLSAELAQDVIAGWNVSTAHFKDPSYGLDQQADYSPKAQSSLWLRARRGIWFGYAAIRETGAYTIVVPGGQDRRTLNARAQAQFNIGLAPTNLWSVSLYGFDALREAQPVSNMTLVNPHGVCFTRRELGLQATLRF